MRSFDDVFPENISIPAPIAAYLNNLGVYKDETGAKLVPRVYLGNFINAASASTFPIGDVGNNPALNKFTAFFPFAMWHRKFQQQRGIAAFAAQADWAKTQVNPVGLSPLVDANDALIGRLGCYTFVSGCRTPSARRLALVNNAYMNAFVALDSYRGRCLYNSQCLRNFLQFCEFTSSRYESKPLSTDASGSKAIYAYCEPRDGDVDEVPTQYDFRSSVLLSNQEMQLVAIMQYRIAIARDDNCVDQLNQDDQLDTVNTSPNIMHAPGKLRISAPADVNATVYAFVVSYKKS
jgi:hypothetical protein